MKRTNSNGKARLAVLRAHRLDPSTTMRELAEATGYSLTAVHYHIHKLQDEGLIDYENKPTGIYDRSAMRKNVPIVKLPRGKTVARKTKRAYETKRKFIARAKNGKRDTGLAARIEQVVEAAKASGTYFGM